jgi:hypothetical protein
LTSIGPFQTGFEGGANEISQILSRHGQGYEDSILLRPKTLEGKKIRKKALEQLQEAIVRGSEREYKAGIGMRGVLKDIFLPKIFQRKPGTPPVTCQGDVCSTLPARALEETGHIKGVVRGKAPHEVLSADFLRSHEFEPVMAHISKGKALSPRAMKILQYGGRAGLGLGLAGTAYGLSEDPALLAAIPGAMIAPGLVRRVMDQRQRKTLGEKKFEKIKVTRGREAVPSRGALIKALEERHIKGRTGEIAKKIMRRFGTRTIPLALAGGLATYLGTKGIQKAIQTE